MTIHSRNTQVYIKCHFDFTDNKLYLAISCVTFGIEIKPLFMTLYPCDIPIIDLIVPSDGKDMSIQNKLN